MLQLAKLSVFNLCVWTIWTFGWTTFSLFANSNVANPRAIVNSCPCNGFNWFDDKSMWCKPGNIENSYKIKHHFLYDCITICVKWFKEKWYQQLTSTLMIVSIWLSLRNSCRNSVHLIKSLTLSVFKRLWLKLSWTVLYGRFVGICMKFWCEQSTRSNSSEHLHPFGHGNTFEAKIIILKEKKNWINFNKLAWILYRQDISIHLLFDSIAIIYHLLWMCQ